MSLVLRDRCMANAGSLMRAVLDENSRQLGKWGVQEHDVFAWITFALEEAGEVAKAAGEVVFRHGDPFEVYAESIQAATLFLKIAEMVMPDAAEPEEGKHG